MSETTETAEKPKKTIQQLLAELNQWCQAEGVVIGVVAQGTRTGQLAPIEDFMPASGSHVATWALQFAEKP
jgi:hypothetical protein